MGVSVLSIRRQMQNPLTLDLPNLLIYWPTMDSPHPRSWTRGRCRPASLCSRQYPSSQHLTARRVRAYFRTAITGTTISFVDYAFVDDTDLCITSQTPSDSEADVPLRMQQALDLWEGGIRAGSC
jgi:hypothetical protein